MVPDRHSLWYINLSARDVLRLSPHLMHTSSQRHNASPRDYLQAEISKCYLLFRLLTGRTKSSDHKLFQRERTLCFEVVLVTAHQRRKPSGCGSCSFRTTSGSPNCASVGKFGGRVTDTPIGPQDQATTRGFLSRKLCFQGSS